VVSVAECLRPGGTDSEIRSDFGQVLVRYGTREWKDLFKQTVGSAEKRRSFPDMETTTLSEISHGSSRNDHLRRSTSTSHCAKSSLLVLTSPLLCRSGALHGSIASVSMSGTVQRSRSLLPLLPTWQIRVMRKSSIGGADITSTSESSGHESRLYGIAWRILTMQILLSRNAIPRNSDAACRPLGLFQEDAISRIEGST
jgi:hypothetical protein